MVLINSPHRRDLLLESCVNQEVTKFIRQVKQVNLDVIYKISNESWGSVFNNNDVNLMFNSFLLT